MFKTVIGLEIHVQLKTKSKMFCGCNNNAENAAPNTLVCPVCLGMPGVLPVANKQAIEWTLKTGLALNCKMPETSKFDRKHYFYPDLPKNYQISQYDMPFCLKGHIDIRNEKGENTTINITRIHLEEDAGKLIHSGNSSLVDLNRAGTPLMEIVTEPEISSPAEAKIFMQELRSILRYLDVSDADMEKGHLRCDANISVSLNDKLGTPVEIKNLNSFRMVEKALAFEEKRQIKLLENGEKVSKETRGWDDSKGITYSQRSKEIAQDYRYFPEPDVPPFEIKYFNIENLKKEIPELPAQIRQKLVDKKVSHECAMILAENQNLFKVYNKISNSLADKHHPLLALAIVNNYFGFDFNDEDFTVSSEYGKAIMAISEGLTKNDFSKVVKLIHEESLSYDEAIKHLGINLENKNNENLIISAVEKVISENSSAVSDYQSGKYEVLGFLVGKIMQETKGQANPQIVNKILKEKLERA